MKNNKENIVSKTIDIEYSDIMGQSYIDYSMSTICQRAVPDIRDGLKPVQRRIVYDMSVIGAASDKPYRKVARVVGDTMGKYHPHGDASIEDALVVQAQEFKKNMPLIDGHGNFGSIEGDQHAASRYIEARLTPFSEKIFLSNLKYDTVDFTPNYDETEKEPQVLPAILPNFLINGAEGIAVGMTTNVPTHNVGEVIDAEIAYMENPEITTEELLKIIPGPDFPTGGIISNKKDLKTIYETGEGKIKIRGKVEIEELKGGKKNIVITEIPYTMIGSGISKFLNDVAALVENRVITDISDISNQSSKDGIRIVVELKKGADAENIKNILYKKTKLEDTFSTYMLAIVDGRPETLSLTDIYKNHVNFLYEVYTRKYKTKLKKETERLEIQEGLIKAIDLIDVIIAVLRGSKNQKDAKSCLMTGDTSSIDFKTKTLEKAASKLSFTEAQTDAILAMRLSRLIGLELSSLEKEHEESVKAIKKYEKLLSSNEELKKDIIKTLLEVKGMFGRKRQTKIKDAKELTIKETAEEVLDIVLLIDRFGYIKSVDKSVYERNKEAADSENVHIIEAKTDQRMFFITDAGKYYYIPVRSLPYGKFRDKGVPIDNFVGKTYSSEERPVIFGIDEELSDYVIIATEKGFLKKMEASELTELKRNGSLVAKLEDNDRICNIIALKEESHIVLITKEGYTLKAALDTIPVKKKNARGIIGIKLKGDDKLEQVIVFSQDNAPETKINNISVKLSALKTTGTGKFGKLK